MRTKNLWALAGVLIGLSALPVAASDRLEMKLRVFEGARQGTLSPPESVTTSYIRPTVTASLEIPAGSGPDKEKEQIMRVFNLKDATLLTEADLVIGEGEQSPEAVRHFFRLNGNAFMIIVHLKESGNPNRFLVLFNEMEADKAENILATEMLLAGGHRAVFGFEDRQGKPYFCSFHITGPPDRILPPPPPPPPAPPMSPEFKKTLKEFESGAVKAWNDIKPPRLIKTVQPVYPEEAKKAGIQGAVVLNLRTDKQGNIREVMVLKAADENLASAAVAAVKQWKYEPFIQDGQAKEVVFTVTVQFKLQ
jgi:TonB family protein